MFQINNGNFASMLSRHDFRYSVQSMLAHRGETNNTHDWGCAGFYVQKINKLGAMSCSSIFYRHDQAGSGRMFGHIPQEAHGEVNAYVTGSHSLFPGRQDITDFLELHKTNPYPIRGFVAPTPLGHINSLYLRLRSEEVADINTDEIARLDQYTHITGFLEGLGRAGINSVVSGLITSNPNVPNRFKNTDNLYAEI